MISGAHVILYSRDAQADRVFLRDVLGFPHVDAGRGWLIFALPPSEIAVHPAETSGKQELYLTTEDVAAAAGKLAQHGIACEAVSDLGWGLLTHLTLPGGGRLGLYQPKHPIAARPPVGPPA